MPKTHANSSQIMKKASVTGKHMHTTKVKKTILPTVAIMLSKGGKILLPFDLLKKSGKIRGESLYLAPQTCGFRLLHFTLELQTPHLKQRQNPSQFTSARRNA